MKHETHKRQRGVTLVMALIMIGALAMMAAMAYRMSTVNVRVVGNAQLRAEALNAAQSALEQTISSRLFITDTAAVAAAPIEIDIDDNLTVDYLARLSPAPTCYRVRAVRQTDLDITKPEDLACSRESGRGAPIFGGGSSTAVAGGDASAGMSLCSDSEWLVRSEVDDPQSGARYAVNQGISTRIANEDATNACP